jgi:hypothetical protein
MASSPAQLGYRGMERLAVGALKEIRQGSSICRIWCRDRAGEQVGSHHGRVDLDPRRRLADREYDERPTMAFTVEV